MDSYFILIVVTIIAFCALASALLVPIYLFLKKEEALAEQWTRESLSQEEGRSSAADRAESDPDAR